MNEKMNGNGHKHTRKTISADEMASFMAFDGHENDSQQAGATASQPDPTIDPQHGKETASYTLRFIEADREKLKKSAEAWVAWLAEAEWPPAVAIENKVVFQTIDGKQVRFSPWFLERLFNLQDEYQDTGLNMDELFSDVLWALCYEGGVEKMKQIIAQHEEEAKQYKKPRIDDGTGYEVIE